MNFEKAEQRLKSLPPKERAIRTEIIAFKALIKKYKKDLNEIDYPAELQKNILRDISIAKTTISALKKQLPRPTWTKYLERDGERLLISTKCFCSYKRLSKVWDYCPYCGHRVIQPTETTLAEKELYEDIQKYLDEKYEGEKFNIICEPKRKK